MCRKSILSGKEKEGEDEKEEEEEEKEKAEDERRQTTNTWCPMVYVRVKFKTLSKILFLG